MSGEHRATIWFLCGMILLVFGVTIVGSGIYNVRNPPGVYGAHLHLDIWWGACLTIAGAVFLWRQWPGRQPPQP
jgi:hypothetical protein